MCYNIAFIFKNMWEWDEGGGAAGMREDEVEKRGIRRTAHVSAACQPLLREDLVWSVRTRAQNDFAKY